MKLKHIANLILAGSALYFVVLCPLILAYGKPPSTTGAVVGCAVPAILSLGLLLLPERLRLSVALLLLSTGTAILAVETFLAVRIFRALRSAVTDGGREYDTRTKLQVVDDYLTAGVAVVPAVSPSAFKANAEEPGGSFMEIEGRPVLPLANPSNRQIVWCNEAGVWESFRSDRHGFNNPAGLWEEGAAEVVTIGDSFVEGFCVEPGQEMAAYIRREHPATINLGISDTGPLAQLGVLKEYAAAIRPRVVLWFFYEGNDLVDLRREAENPILRRYLEPGFRQGLTDDQERIDKKVIAHTEAIRSTLDTRITVWFQRLFGVMSLRYIRARLGLAVRPGQEEMLPALTPVLRAGKEEVDRWGGRLVFVYLPDWRRYFGSGFSGNDDLRSRILDGVRSTGIDVIDINETFLAQEDPSRLFVRPGKHYNALGYRTAAEAIVRELAGEAAAKPRIRDDIPQEIH